MDTHIRLTLWLFWIAVIGFIITVIVNSTLLTEGEMGIAALPFYGLFTLIGVVSLIMSVFIWKKGDADAKKAIRIPSLLTATGLAVLLYLLFIDPLIRQ